MSKTIQITSLTLPQINDLFLSSRSFYVTKRYYGTKISCWTDEKGKIRKITYKGKEVTEANLILNKKVWRLLKKLEDYKDCQFLHNSRFYITITPKLEFFTSGQKLNNIEEIEEKRLPRVKDQFKSKKVAINFIKNQYTKDELSKFDEIIVGMYGKDKTKYTLKLSDKEIEREIVDSSYVILVKLILSDTLDYIKNNLSRFYSVHEDKIKRQLDLIKMICMENQNDELSDKNLIYVCRAFFPNINTDRIPIDVLNLRKSFLYCCLINLFVKNTKLPIKSPFISQEDYDKYNIIKDKIANSYKSYKLF